MSRVKKSAEELIPYISRSLFDRLFRAGDATRNISLMDMKRNVEGDAKIFDKTLVRIRLIATKMMVDVNRRQSHTERITHGRIRSMKSKKQSNGIRSAGDGDAGPVAGARIMFRRKTPKRCHARASYCARCSSRRPVSGKRFEKVNISPSGVLGNSHNIQFYLARARHTNRQPMLQGCCCPLEKDGCRRFASQCGDVENVFATPNVVANPALPSSVLVCRVNPSLAFHRDNQDRDALQPEEN